MSGISKAQAARLKRFMLRNERQAQSTGVEKSSVSTQVDIREGYLAGDLDAGSGSTAEMVVYKGRGNNWQAHTLGGEEEKITVTNRSETFSAVEGDYILVTRINGEWRPLTPSAGTSPIVEGYLTSNLGSSSGASATMAVYSWNPDTDSWSATGETVTIVGRGGFPANSGAYCVAYKVFEPQYVGYDTYRPIVLGCS